MANTFKFGNKKWAVKKDYVLAYNDENNNFKPLPFDFTRDSTATYVDSDGLIKTAGEGIARIDYLDNTDGHLLLEPSRTNLFPNSNDFVSDWTKSNITTTASSSISVDGTANARLIYPSASSSGLTYLYDAITASSSVYTVSAFVKASGVDVVWLYIQNISEYGIVYFDLSNETTQAVAGSSSTPTGTITNMGNDWYRVTCTLGESISLSSGIGIGISDAKGSTTITKSGENGVIIYGLQLETGSYATSYIPTSGTSVTRAADACNGAGNSEVFNDSEGVLYAEIGALADDNVLRFIGISDGSNTNRLNILITNTNVLRGFIQGVGNFDSTADTNEFNKIAIKYESGNHSCFVNGFEISTSTSTAQATSNLSELAFDIGSGSYPFYGKIKDIKVYNTALSDSELATLTT